MFSVHRVFTTVCLCTADVTTIVQKTILSKLYLLLYIPPYIASAKSQERPKIKTQ